MITYPTHHPSIQQHTHAINTILNHYHLIKYKAYTTQHTPNLTKKDKKKDLNTGFGSEDTEAYHKSILSWTDNNGI